MEIRIRVEHYLYDAKEDVLKQLDRMEAKLNDVFTQGEILMALDQVLAKRLDEATNAIAARQKAMQDKLDEASKSGGLTAEEAANLSAEMEADIARLEAMGKDSSNPIPTT